MVFFKVYLGILDSLRIEGIAWLPIAKILTRWYEKEVRGTWWSGDVNESQFLLTFFSCFYINYFR